MTVTRFIKRSAVVKLNTSIALGYKSSRRQKEGLVNSYCEAVNYLLETYSTNDEIAETDVNMMHFTQPSNKLHTECSEAL